MGLGVGKGLIITRYLHLSSQFYLRQSILFSTTTFEQHPPPQFPLAGNAPFPSSPLVDYLIASWGFNPKNAETVASRISTLKTPDSEKPSRVLNYLKQSGFENAQIEKLVVKRPKLLMSSVDRTLKPKFKVFRDIGFSNNEIAKLTSRSQTFYTGNFRPTIDLLRTWFSKKEDILKVVWRSRFLITSNFSKTMHSSISILQKHGVSDHVIPKIIGANPSCLLQKPDWLEKNVLKVIEMGIDPCSNMFSYAFRLMCSLSESNWNAKVEAFKSFGWPEDEILRAFRSSPFCFSISEAKIREKLEFFMNKFNFDSSFLAAHAFLFNLSLEKRIIPRWNFCDAFNSRKIRKRDINFISVSSLTETAFRNRYILPYMDLAPDICEAYIKSTGATLIFDDLADAKGNSQIHVKTKTKSTCLPSTI